MTLLELLQLLNLFKSFSYSYTREHYRKELGAKIYFQYRFESIQYIRRIEIWSDVGLAFLAFK